VEENLLHALVESQILAALDEVGVVLLVVSVNLEPLGPTQGAHHEDLGVEAGHPHVQLRLRLAQAGVLSRQLDELPEYLVNITIIIKKLISIVKNI
jgi:hypothetical protein